MRAKYFSEITLSGRIKELRRSRGLSQKDFASSIGIVQGYLSSIESGKKYPSPTVIIALCHVYQVSEEWLLGGKGQLKSGRPASGEAASVGAIPLLANSQALTGGIETADIAAHISLPDCDPGSHALFAEGDFMAPTIRDGDLVLFQAGGDPGNKEIVLLNNKWGEMILRRCRVAGDEVIFSSDNAAYSSFKSDGTTCIYGKVTAVWRKVKL